MAIQVVTKLTGRRVKAGLGQSYNGPRFGQLTITGLSEGANVVPHGLVFAPSQMHLRPGATGLWGETQLPDATNIYITVGVGGATSGIIDFEE